MNKVNAVIAVALLALSISAGYLILDLKEMKHKKMEPLVQRSYENVTKKESKKYDTAVTDRRRDDKGISTVRPLRKKQDNGTSVYSDAESSQAAIENNVSVHVSDIKSAAESGDEARIHDTIDTLASCPDCFKEFIAKSAYDAQHQEAMIALLTCQACLDEFMAVVSDSSYDESSRINAADILVTSGTDIETVLAVYEDAVYQGQTQLAQWLFDTIISLNTNYTREVLAANFAGGHYDGMQEETREAIRRAIRNPLDGEIIGESLAKIYLSDETSEDGLRRLESISHPFMYANLISNAYEWGDREVAQTFVDQLVETDDPMTLNAILQLSLSEAVPLEDIIQLTERWLSNKPEHLRNDIVLIDMNDEITGPRQRAVASQVLARIEKSDIAEYALQKAYDYEQNEMAKEAIDEALKHAVVN